MKQAGWFGIGKESGRFVPEEQAFLVACKGCGIEQWNHNAQDAAEFYEMLVQWCIPRHKRQASCTRVATK